MEKDQPTSGSDGHSVGTLDPDAGKKHAAMLDRLSNLHQSRLQQSAARRSDAAASPAFESVSSFLDRFSDSKRSIEVDFQHCRAVAAEAADPVSTSHLLKPELEKVAASIAELDRLVAENSYFLPAYEVRSTLKTISDLKAALDKANAELLPRKKFSFRNKVAKKDPLSVKEVEQATPTKAERSNLAFVRESPGFRNKDGAVLVKNFTSSSEEGLGDFTLADLNSCEIYLEGRFGALFVHRLTNCRVYAGPVMGSIRIEEATDCLFMLASHQIRIHEATTPSPRRLRAMHFRVKLLCATPPRPTAATLRRNPRAPPPPPLAGTSLRRLPPNLAATGHCPIWQLIAAAIRSGCYGFSHTSTSGGNFFFGYMITHLREEMLLEDA